MGISRKQALKRIAGISSQIEAHLAKLDEEPHARAAIHWKIEIERWIVQVTALAQSAGSRSEIEARRRVTEWRKTVEKHHAGNRK